MKIYFAGSIRGGRADIELYKSVINYLQTIGEVLTEHVGDANITSMGESGLSNTEIYARDLEWLSSADIIIADVSVPSLGVGFEIANAINLEKKVICIYRIQEEKKLSAMISGCPDVIIAEYQTLEDIKKIVNEYLAN